MTLRERLFGRPQPNALTVVEQRAIKATYGGPALVAYQNDIPLSILGNDWQGRARQYLNAYTVGWFYKAGSRISRDFANLAWTLSYEDVEGDNEEEIVAPANSVPFERLDPLEQFLRLSEYPNPYQTGRAFKQQQQIRLDFTGRMLTYLENANGGGLPTAWYGINPCRMWKARDDSGKLIGWVMDKDRRGGGVPFQADEILVTEYPGIDEDPQGVVEAVYAQVPLSLKIPQHTSDVLQTGGRLAGMAWPKNRTLDEDEFLDAQRAWRNVTSDPNAARRLLIFPEPMEYAPGSSSPQELGIPELASLTRDEIVTAFPIAPEMLMVPMATGLNSGETRLHVKREYWEGTMHPRVEVWEDSFQQQLIPRYEAAVGRPLDFDIEEPNLDDAATLLAKTQALDALVASGFDEQSAADAVGLDHIKYIGKPEPPPMLAPEPMPMDQPAPATVPDKQAMTKAAKDTRLEMLPGFKKTMHEFLRGQVARIEADLEAAYPLKSARKAVPLPWDAQREDNLLKEALRPLYIQLTRKGLQPVADFANRTVLPANVSRIVDKMLTAAGERISGINNTTREHVQVAVSLGFDRGYSIQQIANGNPDEGFKGLRELPAFDEARAELVARTETMLAYNSSALLGYDEFGVQQVEAVDGDFDEECAARNGQVFSIEDAMAVEDHPNGTLDWIPLS